MKPTKKEPRFWWHKSAIEPYRILRAGRAWFHFGRKEFHIEWHHGTKISGALSLSMRGVEHDWLFHIAIPFLFSWFFSMSGANLSDEEREISLRFFDGGIWWSLWMHPHDWNSTDPQWRRECWRPLNTLLGKQIYSRKDIASGEVLIPMQEKIYKGEYIKHRDTWKRSRWPFALRVMRYSIDMSEPIPEPGKGENSWDLEDTALESLTCPAETLGAAVEQVVASVAHRRERYGGAGWRAECGERTQPDTDA